MEGGRAAGRPGLKSHDEFMAEVSGGSRCPTMSGRWLRQQRGLRHADRPVKGFWAGLPRVGPVWVHAGAKRVLLWPCGLLGFGYRVADHEPWAAGGGGGLRCGAGSGEGEGDVPGQHGELWLERLEDARDGGGEDDQVGAGGGGGAGQFLDRGAGS